MIEQVLATSPDLAIGDQVVVRGRYELKSADEATLALYLTQTDAPSLEPDSPAQKMKVKKGSGEFRLVHEIRHPGALHVSFFGASRSFGGVYFGTAAQMEKVKDWNVFSDSDN